MKYFMTIVTCMLLGACGDKDADSGADTGDGTEESEYPQASRTLVQPAGRPVKVCHIF